LNESLDNNDTNKTLNYIRVAFRYQLVNPEAGVEYSQKAIKLSESQKYDRGLSNAYSSLASLYYSMGDIITTEKYIRLAYQTSLKTDNYFLISDNISNLAALLSDQKKYDEALKYFFESISLDSENDNFHGIIGTYERIGELYKKMKDLDKAMHYFELSDSLIRYYNFPNTKLSQSNIASQKASILIKLGEYENSIPLLYSAKNINDSLNLTKFNLEVYKLLNLVYDSLSISDSAYHYFKNYIELENKYFSQNSANKMLVKDKDWEILYLKEKEKFNNIIIMLIIGIVLILVIYTFYYYKKYNNEKKLILELANKNLENENTINSLNELKLELKLSNNNKDRFISILAHDMKNPLFGFMLQTYNLSKKHISYSDEILREKFNLLYENSKELSHLLDSLLEWYQNHSGRIKNVPENLYLQETVNQIINTYKAEIELKNISIVNNINEDVIVKLDKNLLRGIMRNLINNAIKYSYDRCYIKINCNISKDIISISIEDNGEGMSEQEIENTFTNNSKITNPRNDKKSARIGVGLILCKEFTELLNGKLEIKRQKESGTIFTVNLPIID